MALVYDVLANLDTGHFTPQEIAQVLVGICAEDIQSIERRLNIIWGTVVFKARESPSNQDRLVEVLKTMQSLPDLHNASGEAVKVYGLVVWRDLPMFGWDMRDEWNVLLVPGTPDAQRDELISRFDKINQFAARLTHTGLRVLDFSLYLIWTLRPALETPVKDRESRADVDLCLPAAVSWIMIIAEEVYYWDHEFKASPRTGAPGRGGPLWTGKHGFCEERWALWKSRFQALAGSDEFSHQNRQRCQSAVTRMNEIELKSDMRMA